MSSSFRVLHLDESGDFTAPSDCGRERLVLGGLALPRPPPVLKLRAAIERACPGVPWPPHAAQCNHDLYRPAIHLVAPRQDAPEPVREAAGVLASEAHWVRIRVAAERARARPWLFPLGVLDAHLAAFQREHPRLLARLKGVRDGQRDALCRLFGALGRDGAFMLAAVGSPGDGEDSGERWHGLWLALRRRVAQIAPDALAIAVPPVFSPPDGAELPPIRSAGGLRLATPRRFDASAHPLAVAADLLVNQLRFALGDERLDWATLEARWSARGLPPLRLFDAPSITRRGRWEFAIDQALAGSIDPAELDLLPYPRWAVDQARLVVAARRGGA